MKLGTFENPRSKKTREHSKNAEPIDIRKRICKKFRKLTKLRYYFTRDISFCVYRLLGYRT